MVTATYPPHKFDDLLKVYLGKKTDYPDFVKRIHHWGITDGDYKNYAVYEVPDEKLYDGMMAIAKRYSTYAKVEGYKYKIEPLMDSEKAIALLK